jgi:hypothetical protein
MTMLDDDHNPQSKAKAKLRRRSAAGQALIEYLIIFWFAFSFLMLVIQISLMFNAHTMVKLAAFNAARAAVVARDPDNPERPVKFQTMKDKAKLAAWITLLPVIPGMHGRLNGFGDIVTLVTNIPSSVNSLGAIQAIAQGHGRGIVAALFEFLGKGLFTDGGLKDLIDVQFVNPVTNQPITSFPQKVQFDDTSKTSLDKPNDSNLVKVVVRWQYPLVIPFADQIIYAYTHTNDLILAYLQKSPATIVDVVTGTYARRPVWEVGWVFRDAVGLWTIFGLRTPVVGSYVMRMQWDRGPDNAQ